MTNPELIELLKLLSALESWSFSNNHRLPDYLLEKLDSNMSVIEREILG